MTPPSRRTVRRVDAPDPDRLVESIRARGVVLDRWHDRLGELLEVRGQDAECRALLATLQYAARPPRHRSGAPADLLTRLRDALSHQIDLIVRAAALDVASAQFYRGLQADLSGISPEAPGDPIGVLLQRVADQVHAFYEHALGELPDSAWPAVSWQLAPLRDHPLRVSPDADPYTAEGCTVVLAPDETLVKLRAVAGYFGPEAYLSLPQILVHEFFAHVPTRPRENHDIGVFTEGLMDWAALVLFETTFTGPSLHHGQHLHDLRKDHPGLVRRRHTDEGDVAFPTRATGHLMAQRVVDWWAGQNSGLDLTGIRLRLAGLAARLNVYDGGLSMAEKDVFVTAMTPGNPAMAQALRHYLHHPDGPLEPLLAAAGVSRTGDTNSKEPA